MKFTILILITSFSLFAKDFPHYEAELRNAYFQTNIYFKIESIFSGLKPNANEIRQMLHFLLKAEGKKHKAICNVP